MKYQMKWWALTLIALLIVSVTGCGQKEGGTIRIAEVTRSLFYAPQYVALSQGFFKDEGLEVTLETTPGGDKTMTALVSGNADIALVGTETSVYVYNQGSTDPVINFGQVTQTDGTFLLSREPIFNFTWDMLKGKKLLGQRKGGMPEMVSEHLLKQKGVEPFKDVEIIQNVEYANLPTAFVSGTGDFSQLFEPFASQIEAEGKGYIVASYGTDADKFPYTVFMARESYIKDNKDKIQRFTNALQRAQNWVQTQSIEDIADAVQPYFDQVDREIVIKVLDRYRSQGSWATDGIVDKDEYQNLLDVMSSAGELTQEVPYEKIINTSFAEKAKENMK
ncbi:MAG: ABC transporter substrate-binding protein [Bacilli bacterium]